MPNWGIVGPPRKEIELSPGSGLKMSRCGREHERRPARDRTYGQAVLQEALGELLGVERVLEMGCDGALPCFSGGIWTLRGGPGRR